MQLHIKRQTAIRLECMSLAEKKLLINSCSPPWISLGNLMSIWLLFVLFHRFLSFSHISCVEFGANQLDFLCVCRNKSHFPIGYTFTGFEIQMQLVMNSVKYVRALSFNTFDLWILEIFVRILGLKKRNNEHVSFT